MTVKLEALVCSKMLKIFEGNNGTRNYLGFVYINRAEFSEQDMKNTAVMLYSRTARDLKKVPKIEVEVVYS